MSTCYFLRVLWSKYCHTTTNQPTRESYKLVLQESHRLGRDVEWTSKLLCGIYLKIQGGRLCSKVTIWGREIMLPDRASFSSTPTAALPDCGLPLLLDNLETRLTAKASTGSFVGDSAQSHKWKKFSPG